MNNNDGGAIFSHLPAIEAQPELERFFVTPHGRTFEHAAHLFDLQYMIAKDPGAFETLYRDALQSAQSVLIEVRSSLASARKIAALS